MATKRSNVSRYSQIAEFYDQRLDDPRDLNVRLAVHRQAHHHAGIVRTNDVIPDDDADALAWLYHSEEALCDLVWHVIQGLSLRHPERLLDLGCGEGATAVRFSQLAGETSLQITGITLSERQRDIATRNCGRGRFLAGRMLSRDLLRSERFDVVYAIESTEYLGSVRLQQFMKCTRSWLAPQGLLVVVAGSRTAALNPDDRLVQVFDAHYRTRLSCTQNYRDAARMAGFKRAAEIDLGPASLLYWQARRERPVLRNSRDGIIETVVATALKDGLADYLLYAWYRAA